jgi:dTDP-4-dehydrorhamnose reductase
LKRALVTGGSGQVGGAVVAAAESHGFSVSAPGRDVLDLADPVSIAAAIATEPWDVVINCAAYTAVDKAESEPAVAHRINATAPGILARESARLSVPIIHVSTDYVFDGTKSGTYVEADPLAPLGVYGVSKLAGEAAVRDGNPRHAIVRTAWVLSATGANFINTMLRLAEARDILGVVNDQTGCPTSAADIANALLTIAKTDRVGTWHFVNSGAATWHDLAAFVFARSSQAGLTVPVLNAITTADYPTPARRPANSQLDTRKFAQDFGYPPRPWQDAVADILDHRLGALQKDRL